MLKCVLLAHTHCNRDPTDQRNCQQHPCALRAADCGGHSHGTGPRCQVLGYLRSSHPEASDSLSVVLPEEPNMNVFFEG